MTKMKKTKPIKIAFRRHCLACDKCIPCPIQWEIHIQGKRHAREQKRYDMKIGVMKGHIESQEVQVDFVEEKMMENALIMEMVVSESMEEENLSDDQHIIKSFISRGISIPPFISKVCRVHKKEGYIKTCDLIEITENCILVDANELVGIVVFDFFDTSESESFAIRLDNLCKTSGFVKRSKKIKMNYMFMHGAQICNGKFGRYSQSVKPPGGGCVIGKERPSAIDLDFIANSVVNSIYDKLKIHLPSWTDEWEKMVPNVFGTASARLGYSPFTTMASTLNYHVSGHYDDSDSGFGVICWFDRFFESSTCSRSQFRFLDYGLYFKPKQGTLTIFNAAELKHQTVGNHGYSQFGLALAMKKKVLEAGERHMEKIGFGPFVDDQESQTLVTYERRLKKKACAL